MSDTAVQSWRVRPERSGPPRRMLLVAGGVLALFALVGAGVWGLSRTGSRGVPLIEPDARPIKVRPSNPGGLVVPNQNETIFDRPAERRVGGAAPPTVAPQPVPQLAPAPEAPQIERLREQLAPPVPARPIPAPQNPAPLVPAPSVPTPTVSARQAAPVAASAGTGAAAPAPAVAPTLHALAPPSAPAPVPAVPPAAPAAGRAMVQLGALASEEAARGEWDRLRRLIPELAGRQPQIGRFEREGQAPLWRLRTGGLADRAAAVALCEAVKAKAAACTVPGG